MFLAWADHPLDGCFSPVYDLKRIRLRGWAP